MPLKAFEKEGKGSKYVLEDTGRVYLYNDERWVTPYDDLYGWAYYQNAENSGTNVDPIEEWEHTGRYIRQGTVCHELALIGHTASPLVSGQRSLRKKI